MRGSGRAAKLLWQVTIALIQFGALTHYAKREAEKFVKRPRKSGERARGNPLTNNSGVALIVTLWSLLVLGSPAHASLPSYLIAMADQDPTGVDSASQRRELERFKVARVSLRDAFTIAQKLHPASRIIDISFDGEPDRPVYWVKTYRGSDLWENAIDADTGSVLGTGTRSSVADLTRSDRSLLVKLRGVRQEIFEAVIVAERNTAGKAISAGLLNDDGRLNFAIVVIVGDDIKQVRLQPPSH